MAIGWNGKTFVVSSILWFSPNHSQMRKFDSCSLPKTSVGYLLYNFSWLLTLQLQLVTYLTTSAGYLTHNFSWWLTLQFQLVTYRTTSAGYLPYNFSWWLTLQLQLVTYLTTSVGYLPYNFSWLLTLQLQLVTYLTTSTGYFIQLSMKSQSCGYLPYNFSWLLTLPCIIHSQWSLSLEGYHPRRPFYKPLGSCFKITIISWPLAGS